MSKQLVFLLVSLAFLASCKATPSYQGAELPETEKGWSEHIKASYKDWQEPAYIEVADPTQLR